MAVGTYNGSIFIAGGFNYNDQVTEYRINTDQWIDIGLHILSDATKGKSQFYAQKDEILYMTPYPGTEILTFDMNTKQYTSNWMGVAFPETNNYYACIALSDDYLFVVGGSVSGNPLWALSLTTYGWVSNTPSLINSRTYVTCYHHQNLLCTFGGYDKGAIAESECLDTSDIAVNTWYAIPPLTEPAYRGRTTAFEGNFLIIGGYGTGNPKYKDTMHVYDSQENTMTLHADHVLYPMEVQGMLIVGNVIYIFGGGDGGTLDTWLHYTLPTSDPTSATSPPTMLPTVSPIDPTEHPTKYPTIPPSQQPSSHPTANTIIATGNPTIQTPTVSPTKYPSRTAQTPSNHPSQLPSHGPNNNPSQRPSNVPSTAPIDEAIATSSDEAEGTDDEDTENDTSIDDSNTTWLVIAIVAFTVCVIMWCGACCWCCRRQKDQVMYSIKPLDPAQLGNEYGQSHISEDVLDDARSAPSDENTEQPGQGNVSDLEQGIDNSGVGHTICGTTPLTPDLDVSPLAGEMSHPKSLTMVEGIQRTPDGIIGMDVQKSEHSVSSNSNESMYDAEDEPVRENNKETPQST
eukprot:688613_1